MEMMKAVVYDKPGRANGSVKEIPVPKCGDNDVLMKVMACSICKPAESSHDRETGSLLGVYPAVPGHEFAGVVVEVGKNVTDVKVGDHVTADNAYPCGSCFYCRSGKPTFCSKYRCQGHNMQGGFAQYILCNAQNVYQVPDEIPFDHACLSELINCCLSCVKNAEVKYGDNVVIIGAGSSGSIIAQMLKNSNAGRVVAMDINQGKLDKIAKAGVETVLVDPDNYDVHTQALKEKFPNGIDIVIDAAGDDGPMLENLLPQIAPCGKLVLYSFFYFEPKTFHLDPGLMIRKGLRIHSAPLQTKTFGECVKALADKKLDPNLLITATYPIDRYFEALDVVLHDKECMKIIIHPND